MLPGREADNWIIGFPEGDGAGVHFHCPPCLSDVCSFMTDCIRPDRTSVADMWTIENVLRLRLHAGEGIRICPALFCMRGRGIKICWICFVCVEGIRICPDMFCMRGGNKNMPGSVLHAERE